MRRRDLLVSLPGLAAAGAAAPDSAVKGRLRSAICAYSYRDALKAGKLHYDDLVRLAVDSDIDGLDLTVYWFPNTSDSFLLPLRRFAYRSAVHIYSISIRSEMTQPTPELQKKEFEEIRKWVDVAEKLGAGHIRVFGGKVPKGATVEQASGWVVEVLKRSAEYAGSKGVILGLENHGGVTERADTILNIIRRVESPWVGINLDTGNFNREAYEQIEKCVPYAVNVQVKVDIRVGAEGREQPSDWDRICKMLLAGQYHGYLALEYEAKQDAIAAVPPLLRKLNQTVRRYSA